MKKKRFGNKQVSVIGLGSSDFGGRCPESLAREFLDAYWELGGNFIDTARVYGDFSTPRNGESEKVIGRWLRDRGCRSEIFLSTKGGHPPLGDMRRSRLSRAEIRSDLSESLRDLQTDRVDIYWLHRDDESRPVGDIMETLEGLIEEGKTALTGVSNWRTERIKEANRYALAHGLHPLYANQPQFSLAQMAWKPDPTLQIMDRDMYRMHRESGMACCCFSSQARGFFSKMDALGEDGLPEGLKRQFLTAENRAVYRRLVKAREETGLSLEALALAYLTSQPFPCFPLVGASRIGHVLALREAADAEMPPDLRDSLRRMDG